MGKVGSSPRDCNARCGGETRPRPAMQTRSTLRFWLPVLLWIGVIFIFSSDMASAEQTSRIIGPLLRWLVPDVSPATIGQVQLAVRKCAHLTEYGILGLLVFRAFVWSGKRSAWPWAAASWLGAATCAGLDEFRQTFTAARTGSPIDVMIDALGAALGVAIYWWWSRREKFAATSRKNAPL